MTKINKNCYPKSCSNSKQPLEIFKNITTLEDGIKHLLTLAEISQKKLIKLIVSYLLKPGISYYNPGIKTFDSCFMKIKLDYIVPYQIRQLTDCYRASIIIHDLKHLNEILSSIRTVFKDNRFEIVKEVNSFNKPRPSGFRNFIIKIRDLDNSNLIGELQINKCSIKLISELLEHNIYKLIKTLSPEKKSALESDLNKFTRYEYNNALKKKETCTDICKCTELLKGAREGTKRKSKKNILLSI